MYLVMAIGATICICTAFASSVLAETKQTPVQDLWAEQTAGLNDDDLAAKFAPTLRFSANEQFFPTVPFFTAFDRTNNYGGKGQDFTSPDDVAFLDPTSKRWLWCKLSDAYSNLSPEQRKKIAAAFYRVRECDTEQVRKVIETDGARYHRLSQTTRDFLNNREARFRVIEYYFYYINDKGITGHPEDIETFVVFVPKVSSDKNLFTIQVGAAHETGDANNVAIVERWQSGPDGNPVLRTYAFVELGGHAMAPDVYPHGELFRPGSDVNWHFLDAWGVRDVVATVGAGALEPYETWKTDTRGVELQFWPVRGKDDVKSAGSKGSSESKGIATYWLIDAEKFFGDDGVISVWDQCNPEFDGTSCKALIDLECVKSKMRAALDRMPEGSFLQQTSVDSLTHCGATRLSTWTRDGVVRPEADTKTKGECRCDADTIPIYEHMFTNKYAQERAERKKLALRSHEAKRHIVTQHSYYTAESPTAILKPYLFMSRWPYPVMQRSAGPDGEPELYVGIGDETWPFHRESFWLNLRGALHMSLLYEVRQEDLLLEAMYILSPARRIANYIAYATEFPEMRLSAGLILRINPVVADAYVVGAEIRVGVVLWHESDLKFNSPALQLGIALPWSWQRYFD